MRNLDSIFDGAERTAPNPFREDVFASGITPLPGVTELHGEAMTRCIRAFESLLIERSQADAAAWGGSGRAILIAAPRAGYGKSHLVGRVRAVTENLIAPVALPFDPARKVAWETMLRSVFNQYRTARCPQHPGCSLFEETGRFFQSRFVRAALGQGVIDEKEIPETEIALRLQFREVFDPKASNRMVPWLTKRSPEIMDAVGGPLGQRWRLEFDDLVFWNRFFQDASRPKATVFEQLNELTDAAARDRLTQFLRIAADCRPVAFIADHLDGFFGSDAAGMKIAEILTELRFAVPRSVTLLCLNEDVWKSIFEGKIPSAWIDRLTGEAAPLGEISLDDGEALLRDRLVHFGWTDAEAEAWVDRNREVCFGSSSEEIYPREVLRRAAREWDREAAIQRSDRERSPRAGAFFAKEEVEPETAAPPVSDPDSGASDESKKTQNVFSAADEGEKEERDEGMAATPPPSSPEPEPETPPRPSPSPAADRSRETPFPPPPTPGAARQEAPGSPFAENPPRRDGVDDASAAARAAGIDPTRGLTNIEAIIAEIRGGGARALSETQSPSGPQVPPRQQMPFSPPSPPRNDEPEKPETVSDREPDGSVTGGAANPFWATDLNTRFRELETECRHNPNLEWQPYRVHRVIRLVGSRFPAVGQTEETVGERPALTWRVRDALVAMGFEAPENFPYWSAVLQRVVASGPSGKLVLFSHASAPFNYDAIGAMGAGDEVTMRHVDIIEMNHGDVAILVAADRLIEEATAQGRGEEALKAVARQLDPFWRRIGRPLGSGTGATN